MPCLTLELCIARFLLSVIVGEKTQISLFIVHNGSIKVNLTKHAAAMVKIQMKLVSLRICIALFPSVPRSTISFATLRYPNFRLLVGPNIVDS